MKNSLTISFKDTKHTTHLVQFIENKYLRLKKLNPTILKCAVVVSTPHQKQKNGKKAQVTLVVQVAGKELIARRTTNPPEGMDLYTTISDAFRILESQLKEKPKKRVTFQNFRTAQNINTHQFAT